MNIYKQLKRGEEKGLDIFQAVDLVFKKLPSDQIKEMQRLQRVINKNIEKRKSLLEKIMKSSGLIEGRHEYSIVRVALWHKINGLK